jgi:alpha-L-rhamnosidase
MRNFFLWVVYALPILFMFCICGTAKSEVVVEGLRCEYLDRPLAVEATSPRLSWRIVEAEPNRRGQKQTAYRILVASSPEILQTDQGDLWDSEIVSSTQTLQVAYDGFPLHSGQHCWWKVMVWDADGQASEWSTVGDWRMGLLQPSDWSADWISFRDERPVYQDREQLDLPPARHYKKEIEIAKEIRQATVYASALGNYRLYLDGAEVSDGYFLPGWSDYKQRAYYQAFDVTDQMHGGNHCLGAIVTEGWYAGYVGYGLLVGYGPYRSGKNFYGKTPALRVLLNILYEDGTSEVIGTNQSWLQSADGPIREADIIMGERFEAERDWQDWCRPSSQSCELSQESSRESAQSPWQWEPAVLASDNPSVKVPFFDALGQREIELGFESPATMQAYPSPPVRAIAELPVKAIHEPAPGVYIFDLGQNFAGVVRLVLQGSPGQVIQLRHGEMLHPDGPLMTENLRRARATNTYVCRGGGTGPEIWTPEFTYQGFQYVEVTGLREPPALDMIRGIVLSNDLEYGSSFECSDPVMTQFWKNARWTQQANFVDIPTDCPQRDERLGWMGDAQAFVRTASYNADIAAFFTKWLSDVVEAQEPFGAYTDYAPYPMAHGGNGTYGTAWTDAGIICPWTIWKVYNDRRLIEQLWSSMTRFMNWRLDADPDLLGVNIGNTWGDWLNVDEPTPIEYVDQCYHAYVCQLMAEMAQALNLRDQAATYQSRLEKLQQNFARQHIDPQGHIQVKTQTAYVLALTCGLLQEVSLRQRCGQDLADRIRANRIRMTTGFLGTRSILPALSQVGQHDLAIQLFQSRDFPSWGHEVVNGATTVWERWDSYTKEHGFDGISGQNNASMNSFSHYAFGAVMEWAFRDLVGIDTIGEGFQKILIKPGLPSSGLVSRDPDVPVINSASAKYQHSCGMIQCDWRIESNSDEEIVHLEISLPANTTGQILLPVDDTSQVTEGGLPFDQVSEIVTIQTSDSGMSQLEVGSGKYSFRFPRPVLNSSE